MKRHCLTALLLVLISCGGEIERLVPPSTTTDAPTTTDAATGAGVAPDLGIGPLPTELDDWRSYADRHVDVFGVHVVALPGVSERALGHGAAVLAQYLDNDADGMPDDEAVIRAMTAQRATLVMAYDEHELESSGIFESGLEEDYGLQDLHDVETSPVARFDAAIEEVHHLVFSYGWAAVHPDRLWFDGTTDLTAAMDVARGGHFERIPADYPSEAWYHYDDRTCSYDCMAVEYAYWAHTTLLGAQGNPNRCADIAEEWVPCTPGRLAKMDPLVTALLRDPELGLPTVLPDGDYRPGS